MVVWMYVFTNYIVCMNVYMQYIYATSVATIIRSEATFVGYFVRP